MDEVFKALADPSRRALLDALNARNGRTLRELTAEFAMTRQSVSKHLAVLESANLVTTLRRGREKLHYLNPAPIAAIGDRWIRHYDRRRVEALADLTTALENTMPQEFAPDFVYTSYIRSTPERVWQALTDPAFTSRYWGVELISDWQAGSEITWVYAGVTMAHPEQRVYESDRPRRLAFSWHTVTPEFGAATGASPGEVATLAAEGRSRVAFDIEEVGELVKLTVTQSGFPVGSEIREGVSGGWPMIVASLKSLLETGEPLAFE